MTMHTIVASGYWPQDPLAHVHGETALALLTKNVRALVFFETEDLCRIYVESTYDSRPIASGTYADYVTSVLAETMFESVSSEDGCTTQIWTTALLLKQGTLLQQAVLRMVMALQLNKRQVRGQNNWVLWHNEMEDNEFGGTIQNQSLNIFYDAVRHCMKL